jgi:hypothetical protein
VHSAGTNAAFGRLILCRSLERLTEGVCSYHFLDILFHRFACSFCRNLLLAKNLHIRIQWCTRCFHIAVRILVVRLLLTRSVVHFGTLKGYPAPPFLAVSDPQSWSLCTIRKAFKITTSCSSKNRTR